jgi:hypothetical protein
MNVSGRLAALLAGTVVFWAGTGVAGASSSPPNGLSPNPSPGAIFAPLDGLQSYMPPSSMPADFRPITLPQFIGAPYLNGGVYAPPEPTNPSLSAGPNSNLDDDTYRSDTYPWAGPVGNDMQVASATGWDRECTAMTAISGGRIAGICYSLVGPWLTVLDAKTLKRLAQLQLPARDETTTAPSDFNPEEIGGGYYYVDNHGRFVIPTATNHIVAISISSGSDPTFHLDEDYNLAGLDNSDKALSAMPDSRGNIWFETREGLVGTINPRTGAVKTKQLAGEFYNSLAADRDGSVYVVTTQALYRLKTDASGAPIVVWSETYPNDGKITPPQALAGSGTTPTLLDTGSGDYVAIADNADPLDVRVYRRAATLPARQSRLVCSIPVFQQGASATQASLIGIGNSLIATNEAGYDGPGQTPAGLTAILEQRLSNPGMVRIDINPDGKSCKVVWTSIARIWSGVPKLSLASGLIYGTELAIGQPLQDVWYLDAISIKTGAEVWQKQYGSGISANNDYSAVTITPDGSAYIGALIGIYRLWDKTDPVIKEPAPSLELVAKGSGSHQRFAVAGLDACYVRRLVVRVGRSVRGHRLVVANAHMVDGGVVTLRRTFPAARP